MLGSIELKITIVVDTKCANSYNKNLGCKSRSILQVCMAARKVGDNSLKKQPHEHAEMI
jgi:hypothetical protein